MKLKFNQKQNRFHDVVVTPGKYRMRIKGFEPCIAKTGTKQLRCDLEVLNHPEFQGVEKREYFPLTNKGYEWLQNFIEAATDTSHLGDDEIETDSILFEDLLERCVGEAIDICYKVEIYEGLERNEMRRFSKAKNAESPEKEA